MDDPRTLSHGVDTWHSVLSHHIATMSSDPELSKNARKRLLKAEKYASMKAERRARDKEKKRLRAEQKKADTETTQPDRKKRKVQAPRRVFNAKIVIDLGFDDLMSEKEVVSLCSQLAYTYSSNRHSCNPFASILCTSLNGKTLTRLHELQDQHTRWSHVQFLENGYETLWSSPNDKGDQSINIPKESVLYLTGDSEEELLELKEGETYIIGGICDHNRYKNLCLNKAQNQAIRHARLPIGTYLQAFPTRKILTVNQIFDILLQWVEHRDWEKALLAVMPKRKFSQTTNKGETSVQLEGIESDNTSEVNGESESKDPTAGQLAPDDVHREVSSNPELS